MKTKVKILILLAAMLVSTGLRCKCQTPEQAALLQPLELNWWGVYDDPDNFSEIIADYKVVHPNISIYYRKLRPEEFESELLNALAEDRGPDIISLHSTWLTKYLDKLEPLPATTKMAYQRIEKSLGIKEEVIVEVLESVSFTPKQIQNGFLDAVYNDVVRNNQIYGLPLSVDTLALFYNRDLLNNAGIPLPPVDWVKLQADVKKLTFQDRNGNLVQSGIAMGTAENVERSTDILSLLMMQNGAEMVSNRSVAFHLIPESLRNQGYNPGAEAVRFYTDFANPAKEVYTWNDGFANSIDDFAQGRVAMIFGYNYHIPTLEAKRAGKLNYGIASMPQITGRPVVNYANYWIQTVSKKSKNINEAWDFIQFISKPDEAKKYLEKTLKPTALRSLVSEQQENDDIKVFADQLLTAKSWYQGDDAEAAENSLKELITTVQRGGVLEEAMKLAAQKVQQTIR